MSHWRTTTLGVLTIVAALCHAGILYLHGQPLDWSVLGGGLATGIGLLHAADAVRTK